MRPVSGTLLAASLLVAVGGCATTQGVRYVYQDGQFGVVGIPENTDRWPAHYRRQAEDLMSAHFPEGHEIVRAEEVVEGSRTLKVEGTSIAEVSPRLPAALLNAVKLGHTASRSRSDTLSIKECRIIYRRADGSEPADQYAEAPALTPSLYLDPNADERRKAGGPTPAPAPARESSAEEPKLLPDHGSPAAG